MSRATPRLYGLASLALLAANTLLGRAESFPLGGGASAPLAARTVALALGLSLGWAIPGVSLALLLDSRSSGTRLLARSWILGVGYLLVTGLAHAIATSHAPGRGALLAWLALPALAAVLHPGEAQRERIPWLAFGLMAALTLLLWPKLAHEAMNGDGTEAYELARSLDAHPAPYWDLERWEPPGRFGTPAVNPFLANSYLVHAEMAVLGHGELAPRVPLVIALVVVALVAGGLATGARPSGWIYMGVVTALYLLWNAYYVGYEPPFTDLAEPAATDTFMTALFLAGFGEIAAGAVALGVFGLVLSAFVLYSAPVLSALALGTLAGRCASSRRALWLWTLAGLVALGAALSFGWATGDAADWFRQVKSEYWYDFVDQSRRNGTLRVFGQALLMTGGLPIVAVLAWRRLDEVSRALLVCGCGYLAIVLISSYKNLHYLAPLPFVLAAPSLTAASEYKRFLASAVAVAGVVVSWPSSLAIHRENYELGALACLDGLGYEEAALAGDIVYDAFDRPGRGARFALGKHTFARYALELGKGACEFRLSPTARDGWTAVSGSTVTLSVRDLDVYARWRFRQVGVPTSWLFPHRLMAAASSDPNAWTARVELDTEAGRALKLGDRRLLLPTTAGHPVTIEACVDRLAALRINSGASDITLPEGCHTTTLATQEAPWRRGWNLVEVDAATVPVLRSVSFPP
jgi:hypothetical protein